MGSTEGELQELRRLLGELTARVFRIEQALNLPPKVAVAPVEERIAEGETDRPPLSPGSAPAAPPPLILTPVAPSPSRISSAVRNVPDLESRIGSHWLNRIGISAVLIGVSYFLKFAFDNNWIGPTGRVSIGVLAGIAIVIWSERFRSRGYRVFSYSLKAVGIGILYLSLYAAFQVYNLIPSGVAFAMMFAVTDPQRSSGPPSAACRAGAGVRMVARTGTVSHEQIHALRRLGADESSTTVHLADGSRTRSGGSSPAGRRQHLRHTQPHAASARSMPATTSQATQKGRVSALEQISPPHPVPGFDLAHHDPVLLASHQMGSDTWRQGYPYSERMDRDDYESNT